MSAKRAAIITVVLVCLLGACQSSPPTHYFALTAIAPTQPRARAHAQLPLRIERVTIPGELDRLELVRRTTSNQLGIATFDLWAAPLEGMIQRVLADDLTVRLPVGSVASVNEPASGEPRRHLYIDVQEFAGDEHGAVTLQAAWLLQTPDAPSRRGTDAVAATASDATADALAAAMSRALAAFADRITVGLALEDHAEGAKSE
jgi:uncharacterized lipoprotein YmbA